MWQSLSNFVSGDSRTLQALIGVVALLVVVGVLYGLYRLIFAHRLRAPGASRNRAPRLGVVDVFSLDAQRQLVIVRRDNVEHLLMIGGPNDLVIEPQIQRNGAARDAVKTAPPADPIAEPPARPSAPPVAAATPPRRAAMRAAEPAPPPVIVPPAEATSLAPEILPPLAPEPPRASEPPRTSEPPRARPLPTPRQETVRPIPEAAKPVPEVAKPVPEAAKVVPEAVKPVPESVRPVPEAVRPVEPPEPRPAELASPRRSPPPPAPRPAAPAARPNLPSPITPLRPRNIEPPSLEVSKPTAVVEASKAPQVVIVPPPAQVAAPLVTPPPPLATPEKPRGRTEETFYDLESLEAEMARLLGRDG
jgi:flagellar protein FliO/FliZ